jgi:hypothetical protein
MNKKVLYALLIIALLVIVLIFNRGTVNINLLVDDVTPLKSLAFLAFTGIGVAIGVLLK